MSPLRLASRKRARQPAPAATRHDVGRSLCGRRRRFRRGLRQVDKELNVKRAIKECLPGDLATRAPGWRVSLWRAGAVPAQYTYRATCAIRRRWRHLRKFFKIRTEDGEKERSCISDATIPVSCVSSC